MTCSTFYLIALPFIVTAAFAGIYNTILQYYDIVYRPRKSGILHGFKVKKDEPSYEGIKL